MSEVPGGVSVPPPTAPSAEGGAGPASADGSGAAPCRLTRTEALVVAVKRFDGPASAAGEAFDYLLRWAEVYHVERRGPLIGVYDDVDDPGSRRVSGEAWLPVHPDLREMESADPEVTVREVPPEPVAMCEHRGFPDRLGASMAALLAWMDGQGLERSRLLHRQVYREAPKGHPGEWVVELQVPVVRPKGGRATGKGGGAT